VLRLSGGVWTLPKSSWLDFPSRPPMSAQRGGTLLRGGGGDMGSPRTAATGESGEGVRVANSILDAIAAGAPALPPSRQEALVIPLRIGLPPRLAIVSPTNPPRVPEEAFAALLVGLASPPTSVRVGLLLPRVDASCFSQGNVRPLVRGVLLIRSLAANVSEPAPRADESGRTGDVGRAPCTWKGCCDLQDDATIPSVADVAAGRTRALACTTGTGSVTDVDVTHGAVMLLEAAPSSARAAGDRTCAYAIASGATFPEMAVAPEAATSSARAIGERDLVEHATATVPAPEESMVPEATTFTKSPVGERAR